MAPSRSSRERKDERDRLPFAAEEASSASCSSSQTILGWHSSGYPAASTGPSPPYHPILFNYLVPNAQLIGYELAVLKCINPDKPRNFAKAVTTD
jgi:fructoselysine-6-P-deglycase FrlB-like protein